MYLAQCIAIGNYNFLKRVNFLERWWYHKVDKEAYKTGQIIVPESLNLHKFGEKKRIL